MKFIKTELGIIVFCILAVTDCAAQPFEVVKATRQHWAGGVVGRSGITYRIELETKSPGMTPDTVWINGYVYPIDSFRKDGQYIKAFDSATRKIKFSILVGEQHDSPNRRMPNQPQITEPKKQEHIRATEAGTALISYMHKKKQHFFTVKSFTELKQLNYP
jgi:hypothetical protein